MHTNNNWMAILRYNSKKTPVVNFSIVRGVDLTIQNLHRMLFFVMQFDQ